MFQLMQNSSKDLQYTVVQNESVQKAHHKNKHRYFVGRPNLPKFCH